MDPPPSGKRRSRGRCRRSCRSLHHPPSVGRCFHPCPRHPSIRPARRETNRRRHRRPLAAAGFWTGARKASLRTNLRYPAALISLPQVPLPNHDCVAVVFGDGVVVVRWVQLDVRNTPEGIVDASRPRPVSCEIVMQYSPYLGPPRVLGSAGSFSTTTLSWLGCLWSCPSLQTWYC